MCSRFGGFGIEMPKHRRPIGKETQPCQQKHRLERESEGRRRPRGRPRYHSTLSSRACTPGRSRPPSCSRKRWGRSGSRSLFEPTVARGEEILDAMTAQYKPKDALEITLVRRIARCAWRMFVTEGMETRLLGKSSAPYYPTGDYEAIIRHERLCDIQLHRAIDALAKKREAEDRRRRLEVRR